MKATLLNIVYVLLIAVISPVVLWRSLRHGRYRRGLRQKLLGDLPMFDAGETVVWFHAVSVGEILQLETLVPAMRRQLDPGCRFLITTSTDTGFDQAKKRFADCVISWFPLDFSWAVQRAVKQVNPALVVLVELELWPGFLDSCRSHHVPVALVNARLSERSFRGYRRLGRLIRSSLRSLTLVLVQDEPTRDRLTALGVPAARTACTGSIKFDRVITDRKNPGTEELRNAFGILPEHLVLVVGSSQIEEESAILKALPRLRAQHPTLRTIIVPRHLERFDSVATAIEAAGFALLRRSGTTHSAAPAADPDAVILLDTLGELSFCWGLADVALVGGSFGSRGGQNMIEPAAFGAAVTFGPNTRNFADVVHRLKAADACLQIDSPANVESELDRLLADEARRQQLGRNAAAEVARHCGASQKTVDHLLGIPALNAARRIPDQERPELPLAG